MFTSHMNHLNLGWGAGIRTQTDGFRGQRVLETLVLNHYTTPHCLVGPMGFEPILASL